MDMHHERFKKYMQKNGQKEVIESSTGSRSVKEAFGVLIFFTKIYFVLRHSHGIPIY